MKDIAAAIKVSGISKIDLSMDEVKLIVTTLVYDGLLEEVRGAVSRFNRDVSETHTQTGGRADRQTWQTPVSIRISKQRKRDLSLLPQVVPISGRYSKFETFRYTWPTPT